MLKLVDFFEACGWKEIPTRKMENWKYTPIQKLLDSAFKTFEVANESFHITVSSNEPLWIQRKNCHHAAMSYHQKIHVTENTQAEIVFDYTSEDDSECFFNIATEIILEKNASLALYKKQALNHQSFLLDTIHVYQHENSEFYSFTSDQGAALSRTDFSVHLHGIYAKTNLQGIYITNDEQIADHHSSIYHHVPHCQSEQHYRGILNDKSKAIFNGKIVIDKDAQKSVTKQLNKNLLLSKQAEIDTKPELEIYADDVKASHGATIGQLDAQALFYLETRGIDRKEAQQLLTQGFLKAVMTSIRNEKIYDFFAPLTNLKASQ